MEKRDKAKISLGVPWDPRGMANELDLDLIANLEKEQMPEYLRNRYEEFIEIGRLDERFRQNGIISEFLSSRSELHATYIKESQKTKRVSLVLCALLFALGCITIIFSPSEKENLSVIVGLALIISTGGIAGYGAITAKTKNFDFSATTNNEE